MEAIRSNSKAKHIEPIIVTALNTGMRKGEIFRLKWSHVDFKNGYILVEETKTGEPRKIPMNTTLTETLRNHRANSDKEPEHVFSFKEGKPYTNIKTAFYTAIKKVGLEGLRIHDLRHSFASRLVMAGVDLATVKELMGHKDIKMTIRYSHPTPEHKRTAVKTLDQITTILTTPAKNVISFPS